METAGHRAWFNIVVFANDDELATIDRFERTLGEIPEEVVSVRELISRLKLCHFKLRDHYGHILESIAALRPAVDPQLIGSVHPRKGGDAWMQDTTGRSEAGMRYVLALRSWLGEEVFRLRSRRKALVRSHIVELPDPDSRRRTLDFEEVAAYPSYPLFGHSFPRVPTLRLDDLRAR